MGFISAGASAIIKLSGLAVLLLAFLGAMAGVVYMSLSGTEVKVPEIVGKDFVESEKELAALGFFNELGRPPQIISRDRHRLHVLPRNSRYGSFLEDFCLLR